jgi:hypothetical protein
VYLKTRKYIDFSNLNNEADAYDQLLRNIFDRPRRQRPTLGKAPSYIFDDAPTAVTSAQKAKRFCDFIISGKGNPSAAFQDFTNEFLLNFEELRIVYSHEEADTWCERIRANIELATAHRDVFIDAVNAGAAHLPSQQFMPALLGLLERLLPFQERPECMGSYFSCSEDNYILLCYELFLYTFASFVKARKFSEARQLIDYRYVAPQTFGGTDLEGHSFSSFNSYAESLEKICSQQGNKRRFSVMADLIYDRANNKYLRFSDVLQADAVLWLASDGYGWFPRCLVYAKGKLELFVRAVSDDGFTPLRQLLKMKTPQELLLRLASESMQKILHSEKFWYSLRTSDCLNLDELNRCWGTRTL